MIKNKLISATCALVLTVTGLNAETWKFASEEHNGGVTGVYGKAMAKVIEKESNGKIKMRVYYYGQLGGENDIVELTANGTVQFTGVGTGHLGSYVPEVQAFSIPFVVTTNEEAGFEVLTKSKSIYTGILSKKFEDKNLKLLSMISQGEMAWGANKEIRTPEDFNGVKFRTFTSTIPVETYKVFGANPTPLSWGEVYSGLQLGTIDAIVNPMYFIYDTKWFKVISNIIYPGQQPYIGTISTNSKWYNALSKEKQEIVKKAVKAGNKAAYDFQTTKNRENTAKMKVENPDLKFTTLTASEKERFRVLSLKLHDTYLDIVENAYPKSKKVQARKDARKILDDIIAEGKVIGKKY